MSLDGLREQSHQPSPDPLFSDKFMKKSIFVCRNYYDVSVISQNYILNNTKGKRLMNGIKDLASWKPGIYNGNLQLRDCRSQLATVVGR